MILGFKGIVPTIERSVFVAPSADVIGKVKIEKGASIWFGCVLRGDINRIAIGKDSNIQDGSILHVGRKEPCIVGNRVTVGHGVNLHGATVGDEAMIGMGATVLNQARIGRRAIVAAGSLVPEGMRIPANTLAMGVPAKVVRRVKSQERTEMRFWVKNYCQRAQLYLKECEQG